MNGSHSLYGEHKKAGTSTAHSSIPLFKTQEQTKLVYIDNSQNSVIKKTCGIIEISVS